VAALRHAGDDLDHLASFAAGLLVRRAFVGDAQERGIACVDAGRFAWAAARLHEGALGLMAAAELVEELGPLLGRDVAGFHGAPRFTRV
jgi:hypothetical protein